MLRAIKLIIGLNFAVTLCCTFSIMTPISHEARQFAHSPKLPKSEAVVPRYTWETGTTAQSPSRCPDVRPSSRMSSVNDVLAQEPSLRPSSGSRAQRRDSGKAKEFSSCCPRESSTQFSIRCKWLHVVSMKMSPWMTDDDLLTKADNLAVMSTNEATENFGVGPASLEEDQRTNRFDFKYSSVCAHGGCHSI